MEILFYAMLDRVEEIGLNASSSIENIGFGKTQKKEWKNNYE